MYKIEEIELNELRKIQHDYQITSFQSIEWIEFLRVNQNARPVLLVLKEEDTIIAYFIGLIVIKFGVRIFGSPFEGWLTSDMGFITIKDIDYNVALTDVANYAFKYLKCHYIQITDKKISFKMLSNSIYAEHLQSLYICANKEENEILASFKKNGRRDVRASSRKGVVVKRVPFSKNFIEKYYDQLIDTFAKQNLKPFYDKKKLYDLANAYKSNPQGILALEAYNEDQCIATVFSIGLENWAYYMGAASYREHQKLLPNEALFWEFIKYWHGKGIKNFDLVGYRKYKLKYNPDIVDIPVIIFAKYKSLIKLKKTAKKMIGMIRRFKGKYLQ